MREASFASLLFAGSVATAALIAGAFYFGVYGLFCTAIGVFSGALIGYDLHNLFTRNQ